MPGRVVDSVSAAIPERFRADVETLWRYHDMGHTPRRCDVGIGLGSHDLGVAVAATELYKGGYFPYLVFTGANAPTTIAAASSGECARATTYWPPSIPATQGASRRHGMLVPGQAMRVSRQ